MTKEVDHPCRPATRQSRHCAPLERLSDAGAGQGARVGRGCESGFRHPGRAARRPRQLCRSSGRGTGCGSARTGADASRRSRGSSTRAIKTSGSPPRRCWLGDGAARAALEARLVCAGGDGPELERAHGEAGGGGAEHYARWSGAEHGARRLQARSGSTHREMGHRRADQDRSEEPENHVPVTGTSCPSSPG